MLRFQLRPVLLFVLFSAMLMLLSAWSALVWRHSLVVIILAMLATWLLSRQQLPAVPLPAVVGVSCVAFFLMAAYPLLFITPFFDASADAAPVISTIVLNDRLPATYEPFSELRYSYYIGLPLFVKVFTDFFPAVPAYLWMWFWTAVFLALQPVFIFLIAQRLGGRQAGLLSVAIFFGNKVIFNDFYIGEYPLVAAVTFFMAFVWLLLERHWLAFLVFPVIFLLHPAMAFISLLFVFFYWLFFRLHWRFFISLAAAALAALPAVLVSYWAILQAFWAGNGAVFHFDAAQAFFLLQTVFFWVAIPLWIALVAGMFWLKKPERKSGFWLFLLLLSIGGLVILWLSSSLLGPRLIELTLFSSVILAALFLNQKLPAQQQHQAMVLLVILGLALFFSAGYLNAKRAGSKMTVEEGRFAELFKERFPEREPTLFLTWKGKGKMAVISDKIPFDVTRDMFLPVNPILTGKDSALLEIGRRVKLEEQISAGCVPCIEQTNVRFIVVEKKAFAFDLNYPRVLEKGDFIVFERLVVSGGG